MTKNVLWPSYDCTELLTADTYHLLILSEWTFIPPSSSSTSKVIIIIIIIIIITYVLVFLIITIKIVSIIDDSSYPSSGRKTTSFTVAKDNDNDNDDNGDDHQWWSLPRNVGTSHRIGVLSWFTVVKLSVTLPPPPPPLWQSIRGTAPLWPLLGFPDHDCVLSWWSQCINKRSWSRQDLEHYTHDMPLTPHKHRQEHKNKSNMYHHGHDMTSVITLISILSSCCFWSYSNNNSVTKLIF